MCHKKLSVIFIFLCVAAFHKGFAAEINQDLSLSGVEQNQRHFQVDSQYSVHSQSYQEPRFCFFMASGFGFCAFHNLSAFVSTPTHAGFVSFREIILFSFYFFMCFAFFVLTPENIRRLIQCFPCGYRPSNGQLVVNVFAFFVFTAYLIRSDSNAHRKHR